MSRRVFGRGFVAAGLAGVAASPSLAHGDPRRGGTLVATWGGAEPQACYVPAGGGPGPVFSSSKLFERLGSREATGEFVGELAEGWQAASDFKSYRARIRKGVQFHDGTPMTVDDVLFSVREIWRNHAAVPMLREFAGIEAIGDDAVLFRFNQPTPEFFFASLLCGEANYIVPRHIHEGRDPAANPANDAPTGTGPWKFKEWVRGSHFEYVRNEAYWRSGFPYLDRLLIRFIRDPAGRAAALEAGEIQIGVLNPVARPDVERLVGTGKVIATSKGYEEVVRATTLECNMRHPILAVREVRQAIFHALDRELIARTVYDGYARPGSGPIFSANTAFFAPDATAAEFNPKKAADLLDRAGFTRKPGSKRFTLELVAAGWFPENGRIGRYVEQALEDIGIDVNLSVPDRAASLWRIYTDYDFDLAISNQSNPSEPVPTTTQYYTSDGIVRGAPFHNASGFHTAEVDSLVDRIKIETEPGRRKEMVVEFQSRIAQEAPLLPLLELDSLTVASVRVRNHSTKPDFMAASWHDLWLAD